MLPTNKELMLRYEVACNLEQKFNAEKIQEFVNEHYAALGLGSKPLKIFGSFNDAMDARDAMDSRVANDAWAARVAWDARDARDARAARAARDARAARAARDALTIFYSCLMGWQAGEPDQYTVGIREAYHHGLALAIPVAPTVLGWAMEP